MQGHWRAKQHFQECTGVSTGRLLVDCAVERNKSAGFCTGVKQVVQGLWPVCIYKLYKQWCMLVLRKGKMLTVCSANNAKQNCRASLPTPHFMCNRVIIRLRTLSCQARVVLVQKGQHGHCRPGAAVCLEGLPTVTMQ